MRDAIRSEVRDALRGTPFDAGGGCSEFKGGLVYDTSSHSRLWKAEYSRRLSDKWGLSLLYYGFGNVSDNPALRDFYRDSYLAITVRRYL